MVVEKGAVSGFFLLEVDAARPHFHFGKTALLQLFNQAGRRHHHGFAVLVKVLQDRIAPARRHFPAFIGVFGETRVKACGEGIAAALAETARRAADRTFRRDMHSVRLKIVNQFRDLAVRHQRQANFRIGRQRHGAEVVRRDVEHFIAESGENLAERIEGAHDAVQLRFPGVSGDDDFQALLALRHVKALLCARQAADAGPKPAQGAFFLFHFGRGLRRVACHAKCLALIPRSSWPNPRDGF